MRKDHIYWIWHIPTVDKMAVQRILRERGTLDYVEENTRISYPDGKEERTVIPHKLGDYFSRIELLANSSDYPNCVRLLFQRLPTAGRYWKDLMAHLLGHIQNMIKAE